MELWLIFHIENGKVIKTELPKDREIRTKGSQVLPAFSFPEKPAKGEITDGPFKGKSYLDLLYERFSVKPPEEPEGEPGEHP